MIDPSGHGACAGKSNNDFWECRGWLPHGYEWDNNTNKPGAICLGCANFEDMDIAQDVVGEAGFRFKYGDKTGICLMLHLWPQNVDLGHKLWKFRAIKDIG